MTQNYAEEEAASIYTKDPTAQIFSHTLALELTESMTEMVSYTRKIKKTYIQEQIHMKRFVYMKPSQELELDECRVLRVV